MARARTTKKLAQRIDLNYFKRPTPLKRAKLLLSLLLPLIAFVWIAYHFAKRDSRVYSSGHLSEPHAVFETQCAACHVQQAGSFSAKAENSACLVCHDGPIHHAEQIRTPNCAECHIEHHGKINLSAASNQACATCHSNLHASGGASHFASNISSFEDGHPQFAALKEGARDPGTIKLNHFLHMKPIRRSPNGPNVQLDCSDCHRPTAAFAKFQWPYADAKYAAASVSYTDADNFRASATFGLMPHNPSSGRELMAPVKFANACAACHLLTFDKRFDEGVPHDQPRVILLFLVRKFGDYIAAHPNELREIPDPGRNLGGKRATVRERKYTPNDWVSARVNDSLKLLWRKTCIQCHTLTFGLRADGLPFIAEANTTLRWLPHSKFDHSAHTGFSCSSCHSKALTSTESSDILSPGIATCQTCHAPGPNHAESRCFECHTYHDWSRRKEVKPSFTLPALHTGM